MQFRIVGLRTINGFSLTESVIVLGIVGIILGAVWGVTGGVFGNLKLREATEQLTLIVQNIRSVIGNSRNFTAFAGTDITDDIVVRSVFPSSTLANNANITINPWWQDGVNHGIRVLVGPVDSSQFAIRYMFPNTEEGRRDCLQFVIRNVGSGAELVENTTNNFVPVTAISVANFTCPFNGAGTARVGGLAYNLR